MKFAFATLFLVATSVSLGVGAQTATPAVEPSLVYTVQKSDKLIRLTRDLLVNAKAWPEVAKFNALKDPDFIKPGQQLNIPLRLLKFTRPDAKVISVAGDVRLGTTPVTVGMAVPESSSLQTAVNSSVVVELGDGSQVKLLPNTLAQVVNNRGYQMRDPGASASTTWFSGFIRLAHGSLETLANRILNRATPLQVETPTSLVGVRGTQFRVAYEDPASRNARTEVVEGLVRADNPAQQSGADLPKGTGAVINPAQREVIVVKLLEAPNLDALPAEVTQPQGLWPMPVLNGAQAFRVQVASDAKFDQIVRDLRVTTASVNLGNLDPARWFTRIRGIDAQGLEGFDSVKLIEVKAPPPPTRWRVTSASLNHSNGENVLTWTAEQADGQVLAAPRYSAEIASNVEFTTVLQRLQSTAPRMVLGPVTPGTYFVRLHATLADGKTIDSGVYRMDLTANWGVTVFDNVFPLVPVATR